MREIRLRAVRRAIDWPGIIPVGQREDRLVERTPAAPGGSRNAGFFKNRARRSARALI
jgi:hypothetical protein